MEGAPDAVDRDPALARASRVVDRARAAQILDEIRRRADRAPAWGGAPESRNITIGKTHGDYYRTAHELVLGKTVRRGSGSPRDALGAQSRAETPWCLVLVPQEREEWVLRLPAFTVGDRRPVRSATFQEKQEFSLRAQARSLFIVEGERWYRTTRIPASNAFYLRDSVLEWWRSEQAGDQQYAYVVVDLGWSLLLMPMSTARAMVLDALAPWRRIRSGRSLPERPRPRHAADLTERVVMIDGWGLESVMTHGGLPTADGRVVADKYQLPFVEWRSLTSAHVETGGCPAHLSQLHELARAAGELCVCESGAALPLTPDFLRGLHGKGRLRDMGDQVGIHVIAEAPEAARLMDTLVEVLPWTAGSDMAEERAQMQLVVAAVLAKDVPLATCAASLHSWSRRVLAAGGVRLIDMHHHGCTHKQEDPR